MDDNHDAWCKDVDQWREAVDRRLGTLECDVAIIRSNYVTKADLAQLEARMVASLAELERRLVHWFVGTALTVAAVSFSAARLFA